MTRPFVNLEDLVLFAHAQGEKFAGKGARIGSALGAKKLGYGLTELPPGKAAWPFHAHHSIEEMFLVLAGEGTLRWGEARHPIRAGDCICAPAGGPAHQIVNTSDAPLRFLSVSSIAPTDVVDFPDSGKIMINVGSGAAAVPRMHVFKGGTEVDYWDGE